MPDYTVIIEEEVTATTVTIEETITDVILGTEVLQETVVIVDNAQGPQGAQGPAGTVPVFSRQNQLSLVTGGTRFYFENAGTITKIRASVGTAPTGAPVVIQTLINGVVVATTTIAAGSNTQLTTLTSAFNSGDYATVNITGIGSTFPGSDLTVLLTII